MPRSWSYLKTPWPVFLIVMAPINGLMVALILGKTPIWMSTSAGIVLALTILVAFRGYVRRLVLTSRGPRMIRLTGSIEIPWSQVRRVGVYAPGGGIGGNEYVYITTRDTPPMGKWDIDDQTFQLQDRPGLIEAIEASKRQNVETSK
ncbi:MAG: hypothetical protein ACE5EQ_00825 [Phycisphaerae bacterium]